MKKDKDIKRSLENLNGIEPTEEELEIIEELAENYADKSEDEIFVEIIRLNEEMESKMTPEEYEAIFEKLENIRPFLDEEQEKRLDRILKALKKK